MKKYGILKYSTAFIIVLIFVVGLLFSQTSKHESKTSAIHKELQEYVNNYGNSVFKSFFSIEEIRPYSILQIDRFAENYTNIWTEPQKMVLTMSKKEKELLLKKVTEFVENQSDEQKKLKLMSKIKDWSIADLYFTFLNEKIGINNLTIITAFADNPKTKSLMNSINLAGNHSIKELSPVQADELYIKIVNYISTLGFNEQLKYYSDVMGQVALASNK